MRDESLQRLFGQRIGEQAPVTRPEGLTSVGDGIQRGIEEWAARAGGEEIAVEEGDTGFTAVVTDDDLLATAMFMLGEGQCNGRAAEVRSI